MVHGMLERMGEPLPPAVTGGDAWAGRRGARRARRGSRTAPAGTARGSSSSTCTSTRSRSGSTSRTPCGRSRSRRRGCGSRRASTRVTTAGDGGRRTARFESYEEAYQLELVHFHRCMLGAEECRTPPAQARIDQVVLTEMFRKRDGHEPGPGRPGRCREGRSACSHRDRRAGGARPLGGDGDEQRVQRVARLACARGLAGCDGEEVLDLGRVRRRRSGRTSRRTAGGPSRCRSGRGCEAASARSARRRRCPSIRSPRPARPRRGRPRASRPGARARRRPCVRTSAQVSTSPYRSAKSIGAHRAGGVDRSPPPTP